MSFSGIFQPHPIENPQFILIGAPFDGSSSFRFGARRGPMQIRQMSESLSSCTERGIELAELAAWDGGNLNLSIQQTSAFEQIESSLNGILELGAVPIILGGDHSITIPAFKAVHGKYDDLKLLYFDAHPDLYDEYDGDKNSHACVVARILELDGVTGSDITQVGIRTKASQIKQAQSTSGIKTIHAWEIDEFLYEEKGPVYLSLDIDVLDPAFAPGCGNPVPGGLTSRELFEAIRKINANVVAVDIVEVNPQIDPTGITAIAAVRALSEILAVICGKEKNPS